MLEEFANVLFLLTFLAGLLAVFLRLIPAWTLFGLFWVGVLAAYTLY